MKRNKTEPAGWNPGSASKAFTIIAEKDVNQVQNRKRGLGSTWSHGHHVRQLGLASLPIPKSGKVYFLYSHSQISNRYGMRPAGFVGMTREDLEWVVAVALRELTQPPE
jgi:hypothetical protein